DYADAVSACPANTACGTVNGTTYASGFCVFQPPAPFQSEYTDASNELCYRPCTAVGANCAPLGPSYDQLVKWGAADVNSQLFGTPAYGQEANNVGIGLGFGVATAVAITGLSLATTLPTLAGTGLLTGAATVSAFSAGPWAVTGTALFPFSAAVGVTVAGAVSL